MYFLPVTVNREAGPEILKIKINKNQYRVKYVGNWL